jgi:hypothetical protein
MKLFQVEVKLVMHLNVFKKILSFLILLFLVSCSAKGPAFSDTPQVSTKALVYFYREPNFVGAVSSCLVGGNGNTYGDLYSGGYVWAYLEPGLNKITAKFGVYDFDFDVKLDAGRTYYIECGGYMKNNSFIFELKTVDASTGYQLIKDNKYQGG